MKKNKNILNIIKNDFRSLTASAVTIVILIGLVILPCLYAWFNILSNWDPYTSDATSNVEFAVANEDKGADMMGLNINVGEKIVDAMEANDDIDWTFVDSSEEAIEGVKRGDYYATLVIPEDFTENTLSFATGELQNPKLLYYENKKKNAVMPKITGMAKSKLQQEVDKTFIETIGKYVMEADSIAEDSGVDPQNMFADVSGKMDTLGEKIGDCKALVGAAVSLSDAAGELINASDSLIDSSQNTLAAGEQMLDGVGDSIPDEYSGSDSAVDSVMKVCEILQSDLTVVGNEITDAKGDMKEYNQFVDQKLDKRINRVKKAQKAAEKVASALKKLKLKLLASRFTKIANRLQNIQDKMNKLKKASDTTWGDTKLILDEILGDISYVQKSAGSINHDVAGKIDGKIDEAIRATRDTISRTKDSLDSTYGKLDDLSAALGKSENTLGALDGGLLMTLESLDSMQKGFRRVGKLFRSLASSDKLKDINVLLTDGSEVIAENLASPVKMKEKVFYETSNYGSSVAPFYTTLGLWVGALFTAVFILTEVKRRKEDEGELTESEKYFGRYRVYLSMGIAQVILMTLGVLFYCGIDCLHPWLFFLAALVTGITYVTMNYVLRYLFGKIGLAISVLIVLIQVAGSGGTYPVQVLPQVFQKLYPIMPFHYSMDAMRESVMGMYGNTYIKCLGVLVLMMVIFFALGLLLRKPAHALNRHIDDSLEACELME